jgi:hypothetical protein
MKMIPSQNSDAKKKQQEVQFLQPLRVGAGNLQKHIWAFVSVLIHEQSIENPEAFMHSLGLEDLISPLNRRDAIRTHFTGYLKDGKRFSENLNLEQCLHLGDDIVVDMTARLRSWREHKLFLTHSGDVGIGPSYLSVGDDVVVLAGCQNPAILRGPDESGCFVHVGQAFVFGLTDSTLFPYPVLSSNKDFELR